MIQPYALRPGSGLGRDSACETASEAEADSGSETETDSETATGSETETNSETDERLAYVASRYIVAAMRSNRSRSSGSIFAYASASAMSRHAFTSCAEPSAVR